LPNIKEVYAGCYSADTIPKKLPITNFAIVNTDISTNYGQHWYIALRYSASILEVFDSLGIDSQKKSFLEKSFHLKGIKKIIFNTTQFQKDDSDTCGKFVLYFIVNRLYNLDHSFETFLEEIFVQNQDENEKLVKKFYNELRD